MGRFLIVMWLLALALPLSAQITVELLPAAAETSSGGGTISGYPINTYWHDQRLEAIYLASELAAAGLGPNATINAMHLKCAQLPGKAYENHRIRIQHTALTTIPATYTLAGWTSCHGPVTTQPAGFVLDQWLICTFTTPFVWNGTDNLLVDFTEDGTSFVSGGACYMRATTAARSHSGYSDSGWIWPFDTTTNATNMSMQNVNILRVPSLRVEYQPGGPAITASATAGVAQNVATNFTGPGGNGIHAGTFTLASNSLIGAILDEIKIQASGSGNDQNAYSEVRVYRDSNNNTTFDVATDALIGTVANFLADNGVATFAVVPPAEKVFGTSETRRYFVVVKLNGPTPATNGQTFNYAVSDLTVQPGTFKAGVPTTTMLGLVIVGPTLTAAHIAPVPPPVSVATTDTGGGNGVLAGTFNIGNNSAGPSTLNSITLTASGTGNDAGTYTEVAIVEDTNSSTTWEFGTDLFYAPVFVAYPVDNGSRTFIAASPTVFAASETRRYFVVVKLNGPSLGLNGNTLSHGVSALGVGAGTAIGTLPLATAPMPGITILGPHLTVAGVAGLAQSVLTTEQGTGNNGRLANSFTVSANAPAGSQLASITLRSTGTGNDLTAFTQVALYYDFNNNGTFEFGTDTLYGSAAANFPSDNGDLTFTMNQVFTTNETRRYLIVCKLNGVPATHGLTFNFIVQAITVNAGTQLTGFPSATLNGFTINGPVFVAAVTAGTAQPVLSTATGTGGNGISAGTFTLANNNIGTNGTLTGITITSLGTGNGQTAYSSVQLFQDANANSVWDFGTDTQVGATLTSFSAANGIATFAVQAVPPALQAFDATIAPVSKRYFIVVKLNGATPASVGNTFNYQLTGITFNANGSTTTVPSATTMLGLTVIAPSFTMADVPHAQVITYRTMTDILLQHFTITYPAGTNNSITAITIQATGSGNDATAFSQVRLFHDVNNNGVFDGPDALVGSVPAFSTDNGNATFNLAGPVSNFVPTDSRAFLVIADFNNTAAGGATFQARVAAAPAPVPGYVGTTFTGLPTVYSGGAQVVLPQFQFTDNSNPAIVNAFMGDAGFELEKFTVEYPSGPANTLGSITLTASGSGNDLVDYSGLHLVLDDPLGGTPGSLDAGDLVVDSQPSFNANNGQVSFNVTGPAAQFVATDLKQFIIAADFNQLGVNATTFAAAVTAAGAMNFGGQAAGLPLNPSAGLNLLDANLYATFNGPGIAVTVNSDSQGINNEGLLLCDVTLATGPGSEWSINQLVFVGTGTANHATAYSDLWLYEDNGNGVWDGPNIDSPAASPSASFNAGTFDATFDLLNTATGLNANRRFYLLGRLSGAATSGQTLNARLDAVGGTPAIGGSVRGLPLVNSTALIIESTALTVLSGPATAPDLLRKAGTAFIHPILNVRLAASNNNVTVNAITFSNAGTGDFGTSLSGTGFEVWLDDGDGVFTAGDALIFQGAGAGLVNATFTTPVTVLNSGTRDLWVVLDVLATAGNGAAVPRTYQTVVDNPTHVTVVGGATVLMGTPAPQSNVMRLVDFFVSSFDPVADLPTGGKDITITGSGFMSPVIVMIDGNVCPGAAVVSGTQVTGIQVPPGTGLDLAITIKSGQLDPETLTQTFDYVPLQTPKPSTSGCVAEAGASVAGMMTGAGMLFAILAVARRRRSA